MLFRSLVWAIAGGMSENPEAFTLATGLTRFMFPYIAFMSLVALAAAVLNTRKKFALPAATPILLNISFILATVFLADRFAEPVWALAVAVIGGGVLQLGAQVWGLSRIGVRVRPRSVRNALHDENVRRVQIGRASCRERVYVLV